MTEFAEDRENELSALESIYEQNLQIIKKDGLQKFDIQLTGCCGQNTSITNTCTIRFTYTKSYPQEAPLYEILKTTHLSDEESEPMRSLIDSVVERSLGFIMVFDVLSEVQEKLNSLCEHRLEMQLKAEDWRRRAKEREEEAKFQGERVTVESFLIWSAKFIAEKSAEKKNKVVDETGPKRLTGRDLFLRDHRYDDSDLKFLAEDGETFEVDERLFADIGDLDICEDIPSDDDDPEILATA